MDLERLGLTVEQQAQIDEQFLETTLSSLQQRQNYVGMAWLTDGPLGAELEAVYDRTLDAAHESIIAKNDLDPVTVRNLGRLSFIDTLQLPSCKIIPKKAKVPDENRGRGDWWVNRRLFVGTPNGDQQ